MASTVLGADRIVLRNLKVISDRSIRTFSDDGVELDDERVVRWDEIERGSVSVRQAEFDRLLNELGEPLYRLRQRLKVGDFMAAGEPAEALFPRFAGRRSDSGYLVCQGVMWSRLAQGKREAAVAAYLRCLGCLRERPSASAGLPGERRLNFDAGTGFSSELLPVWFDAEAARGALDDVRQAARSFQEPIPDGVRLYFGTLALSAGESESARRVLEGLSGDASASPELRVLAEAAISISTGAWDMALSQLAANHRWSKSTWPLATYWMGLAKLASDAPSTQREGVLELIRLPALAGETQAELSGAALFHLGATFEKWNDTTSSIAVRRDLVTRFGSTHFARRLEAETGPAKSTTQVSGDKE